MDEEALKKENEDLKAQLATAIKEKGDLEEINKTINVELSETKTHLLDKTDQFKKFRDLTKEEKAKMTDTELELMRRQESFEDEQKKFRDEQSAAQKKTFDDKLERMISEKSKGNKEVADKIRFNLARFKDPMTTDTEIEKVVSDSFNLVKVEAPDLVNSAISSEGRAGGEDKGDSFDTTPEGAAVAKAMGLGFANKKEEAK